MGDCLLCPPGDRHVPDDQLPDHMRVIHPDADPVPLELWPDGGPVIEDQALEPDEFGGQPPSGCVICGNQVAGFRGRYIHTDGHGGVVRGLDHDPQLAKPSEGPP